MFLLAYRFSKHEITGVTPAELYFARDLRLLFDLLRGNPPKVETQTVENFMRNLKEKLGKIHSEVRRRMKIKSSRIKSMYDRGARQILFKERQRVWLFNPRRKRGKTPKLQSDWEGLFYVVKRLSDVIY